MPTETKKTRTKVLLFSLFIIFILLMITMGVNTAASPEGWTDKIKLSYDNAVSGCPSVVYGENRLYVIWYTDYFNQSDVYCRISNDHGKTWENTINLTSTTSNSYIPAVDSSGNTVHVVWKDSRNGNPEIYYKRSKDGSINWSEDRRLTYNSSRIYNIFDIRIGVEEKNIHIVWKDYRTGSSEIFYKRSLDNGDTWSKDIRLTHDYNPSYSPSIVVINKNVHIVWEDWDKTVSICYMKSTDNGNTWNGKKILTDIGNSYHPWISANNNTIHVVWQSYKNGSRDIFYKKSLDNGNTWSDTKELVSSNSSNSIQPKLTVDKNTIYLVRVDERNGNTEIYYKRSLDNGDNWSEDKRLTYDDNGSYTPAIVMGKNKTVHVVWQDYDIGNTADICYKQRFLQGPVIHHMNLSDTTVYINKPIKIQVYAQDREDNLSQLICKIQYKSKSGSWMPLNTTFLTTYWEAVFAPTNTSEKGTYDFRAKIIDTDNDTSDWYTKFDAINIIQKEKNESTPGFKMFLLAIGIIIIILLLKTIIWRGKK